MNTVNVLNQYKVHIGSGLLGKISGLLDLAEFSKIVVIADGRIPAHFLTDFDKIIISSGEDNKTIQTAQTIWKRMLELGCDRKTLVINLGGGVVGDMGGFAAACYMRGVKFIQAPTTILSAVDASVGGKVGIDFANVKNLIGSFSQPIAVIVDTDTFKSLPEREFISGFGEIIKHGLIYDKNYFLKVTSKKPKDFSSDEITEIITRSCEIKAEIISTDEKESGKRKLLNFGHTVGHALESISLGTPDSLLHGEAVSIGMVAEAHISLNLGLINEGSLKNIENALANTGLPIRANIPDLRDITGLISKDKKSEKGKVNWTLLESIGRAVIDKAVDEEMLIKSLKYISI